MSEHLTLSHARRPGPKIVNVVFQILTMVYGDQALPKKMTEWEYPHPLEAAALSETQTRQMKQEAIMQKIHHTLLQRNDKGTHEVMRSKTSASKLD